MLSLGSLLLTAVAVIAYASRASIQSPGELSLEDRVRPLLVEDSSTCHGEIATSGLRIDSKVGLLQGGTRGLAITSGDPVASLLVQA